MKPGSPTTTFNNLFGCVGLSLSDEGAMRIGFGDRKVHVTMLTPIRSIDSTTQTGWQYLSSCQSRTSENRPCLTVLKTRRE